MKNPVADSSIRESKSPSIVSSLFLPQSTGDETKKDWSEGRGHVKGMLGMRNVLYIISQSKNSQVGGDSIPTMAAMDEKAGNNFTKVVPEGHITFSRSSSATPTSRAKAHTAVTELSHHGKKTSTESLGDGCVAVDPFTAISDHLSHDLGTSADNGFSSFLDTPVSKTPSQATREQPWALTASTAVVDFSQAIDSTSFINANGHRSGPLQDI